MIKIKFKISVPPGEGWRQENGIRIHTMFSLISVIFYFLEKSI